MAQRWQSNISTSWLSSQTETSPQLRDAAGRFVSRDEEDLLKTYQKWKCSAGNSIPRVQTPQIDEDGQEDLLDTHLSGRKQKLEKYMNSYPNSYTKPAYYLNSSPGGITRR